MGSLNVERVGASLFSFAGRVFCLGGKYKVTQFTEKVEYFDEPSNSWICAYWSLPFQILGPQVYKQAEGTYLLIGGKTSIGSDKGVFKLELTFDKEK